MVQWLRQLGVSPNLLYGASMASILLSLALWFVPRAGSSDQKGRPERLAIFVGLWPPTLAILGNALRQEEQKA